MSSTNKTPNLGLCQWVETDPFLREDMNGDFAKIDGAFKERTRTKLFDITLTGAVPTVRLDFSEIDVDQFSSLLFRIDTKTDEKCMRINGVSTEKYISVSKPSAGTTNCIFIEPGDGRLVISRFSLRYAPYSAMRYSEMSRTNFPFIKTFEIYPNKTTKPFEEGDKIAVWGVRL